MTGVHSPQVLSPEDRINVQWQNTDYGKEMGSGLVPINQGHIEREMPPIDIIPLA